MTVSFTASDRAPLPTSLRNQIIEAALDDIRAYEEDPGPFSDCDVEDVELKHFNGMGERLNYKLEYTGDRDDA